jgi:hypothetical protein
MRSVILVSRYYSTPTRIYNFNLANKIVRKIESSNNQKRNNSYDNMYSSLKKKILEDKIRKKNN